VAHLNGIVEKWRLTTNRILLPNKRLETPKVEETFDGENRIVAFAVSKNSKTIFTGTAEGEILATDTRSNTVSYKLTSVPSEPPLRSLSATPITKIVLSPDGALLISLKKYGIRELWDLKTRTRLPIFGLEESGIMSAAFSPNGKTLVMGTMDGKIGVWDVATQNLIYRLLTDDHTAILNLQFSSDGKTLFSDALGSPLRAWSVEKYMIKPRSN
jgi:WD40 repeat protein